MKAWFPFYDRTPRRMLGRAHLLTWGSHGMLRSAQEAVNSRTRRSALAPRRVRERLLSCAAQMRRSEEAQRLLLVAVEAVTVRAALRGVVAVLAVTILLGLAIRLTGRGLLRCGLACTILACTVLASGRLTEAGLLTVRRLTRCGRLRATGSTRCRHATGGCVRIPTLAVEGTSLLGEPARPRSPGCGQPTRPGAHA